MTDASATAVRDARRTWLVGGSLFIAYGVIVLGARAVPGLTTPAFGWIISLLWALGFLVFAFGIRRQGSVVARQPAGVITMVFGGLLPLVAHVMSWLLPIEQVPDLNAILMFQSLEILSLASLVIAAVLVGRAGAVPHRVRWVPLIVLVVAAGLQVVVRLLMMSGAAVGQEPAMSLYFASGLLGPIALLLLGVLAIFFAPPLARPEPSDRTVTVYGPPPSS